MLVVGAEQMTTTPAAEIGRNLLKASYVREEADIEGGFAGIFGKIAALYFQRWGDQSDALARIAAKNHKNGVGNPFAQIRKDLGYEFCRTESEKNPRVAGPLKRTDCSLVSDGAAAVVLADVATALKLGKAVALRSAEHVQDFLPMSKRDVLKLEGCARGVEARARQRRECACRPLIRRDPRLLHHRRADGIRGDGARAGRARRARGRRRAHRKERPAAGQSIGRAQGQGSSHRRDRSSMHALAAMQLTGRPATCRSRTRASAASSTWAAPRVANYVSILERIK